MILKKCKFLIILAILILINPKTGTAQTASVNATVQISVCGNNVKEGGEECDNSDHNNKTCSSYGYNAGTLICNNDCTFNTNQCYLIAVPNSDSDDSDSNSDSSSNSRSSSSNSTPNPNTGKFTPIPNNQITTEQVEIPFTPSLPETVKTFDINNDNKIDNTEYLAALNQWYGALNQNEQNICDINKDKYCNVIDFSVLLHYINKT